MANFILYLLSSIGFVTVIVVAIVIIDVVVNNIRERPYR